MSACLSSALFYASESLLVINIHVLVLCLRNCYGRIEAGSNRELSLCCDQETVFLLEVKTWGHPNFPHCRALSATSSSQATLQSLEIFTGGKVAVRGCTVPSESLVLNYCFGMGFGIAVQSLYCNILAIQSWVRPIATNLDLLARVTASTRGVPQMSQLRVVIATNRQALHFPFFSKNVLVKVTWPLKHLLTSWSCMSFDCCKVLWGPQGEKSYRTAHVFGVLLMLLLRDYIIFLGVLRMVEIKIVCINYTYYLFPMYVINFVNVFPGHLASFLFSLPLNTSF